jgi:hypothetical protein
MANGYRRSPAGRSHRHPGRQDDTLSEFAAELVQRPGSGPELHWPLGHGRTWKNRRLEADRAEREEPLRQFLPRYSNVIADHVTLRPMPSDELPDPVEAAIVGRADDKDSLECLVAMITARSTT